MNARRTVPALLATVMVAACGSAGAPGPSPETQPPKSAPRSPSRPGITGRVLVKLERFDGQFGRHDTLTVTPRGRANLVLAHGGGGFRNASCRFSAGELRRLRRDLRLLPIDGRRLRTSKRHRPKQTGVLYARPPVFVVTYRGRLQIFGGERMRADGAVIAGHISRVLTAREARCRVTFHRP